MTKEKLQTLLSTLDQKGEKGISLTINGNDDTNKWGQNLSVYVSQTKEQREAKQNKFYVGNGKVFWNNGSVVNAEKKEEATDSQQPISSNDQLPF